MSVINLKKEWERIIQEVDDKPKYATPYPKEVVQMRDLLLFAQVLLEKMGNKENVLFHTIIYQKIMTQYHRRKRSLKV